MEAFYKVPFGAFERYSPYGRPDDVAELLLGYVEVGVRDFDVAACAGSAEEAIALTGDVKRLLNG